MASATHRAVFALGRLSEAFDASRVAEAWAARSRIEAVIRLLHADGLGIDRDRVLRLSYDLAVPHRIGIGGDAQVLQIIAFLDGGPASTDRDSSMAVEMDDAEAGFGAGVESQNPEILLGSLWRWLTAGRRPSVGYVAFVRCLAAAGLTPRPLGALAWPTGLAHQTERAWVDGSLARLAAAADGARRDLGALALSVADWRRRLGRRRRHSRMDALIDEIGAMLVATPVSIARRLGLSLRGASVMLEELADLGVLVEVTGRKSWKIFVPSDLVVSLPDSRTRRREARSRPPAAPPPDLTPLVDDADAAIARAQAAMARLRSGRQPAPATEVDTPVGEGPEEDQPTRRS